MKDLAIGDLEHAPCGFLIFSDAGVITGINETLLMLLGYTEKDELLGKNIETLFTIAGRIFYQTHFFPLLRLQGKADEIFFSLKTKNRADVPVMCNAVRKDPGGSGATHCIFMPVTERRKYEQELLDARRHAERALEQNQDLMQAKKELEIHAIELDRHLSRLTRINDDISQFSKVISHDLQESIRKIAIFSDIVSG
jgi:sigma-B regulation protein RsbU (phosphoserine phosphatase)